MQQTEAKQLIACKVQTAFEREIDVRCPACDPSCAVNVFKSFYTNIFGNYNFTVYFNLDI